MYNSDNATTVTCQITGQELCGFLVRKRPASTEFLNEVDVKEKEVWYKYTLYKPTRRGMKFAYLTRKKSIIQ